MEKRRRARINNCLLQLKSLVLQAMKKDVSIHLFIKEISVKWVPPSKFSVVQSASKSHWTQNVQPEY